MGKMNYYVMKGKKKMKKMKKRKMKKENLRENVFASVGFFFSQLVCIKHLRGGKLHQILNQVLRIESKRNCKQKRKKKKGK